MMMKVRPCSARTKEIEGTASQCFQRRWEARPAADAHRFPQSVQLWPRSRAASGFFRRILFSVISSERSFSAIREPWCSKVLHLDLSPASLKSDRRNFERDTRTSSLYLSYGVFLGVSSLFWALRRAAASGVFGPTSGQCDHTISVDDGGCWFQSR